MMPLKQKVHVTRRTTESEIRVDLDFSETAADYRKQIRTPLPFLSHMIEHIAYRGNMTIATHIALDEFTLTHVICEDLGQTMGRAFLEYLKAANLGAAGYGYAVGIIDEAQASVALSFENRVYFDFDASDVKIPEIVEGMESADLLTFLEGFCQGALCTMHVDVKKGVNPHHIFEAVFRAFGLCLRAAFAPCAANEGKTAGVAGNVTYDVTVE
jgi:imidazoleglycerol-phosphate dehydratase